MFLGIWVKLHLGLELKTLKNYRKKTSKREDVHTWTYDVRIGLVQEVLLFPKLSEQGYGSIVTL